MTDVAHCGACGAVCSNSQFCGRTGCSAAIVANVCQGTQLTFLTDTLSNDDTDTATIQTALLAKCIPVPATTVVANDSATNVNATSGEPVTGNVFVVLGGPYRQTLVQYLENHGVTSVYYAFDASHGGFNGRSADGGVDPSLSQFLYTDLDGAHSSFVIETVRDPASGTLLLALYGLDAAGTDAATFYFVNHFLPNLGAFTSSYYVYDWSDGNGNKTPDDADTFTLKSSG